MARTRKKSAKAPKRYPRNSPLSLRVVEGLPVTVRLLGDTVRVLGDTVPAGRTDGELRLQLQPDQPVIVGRQEGGQIDYLDPAYRPTQMMPASGQMILTLHEGDLGVSRGHFMLRASPLGVLLTNGVPRRGGGIRPPMNGTYILAPVERWMEDGEDFLIEKGGSAKIQLPNGTVILLWPGEE